MLKRLRLRSWRRGTKEMDLILGAFADSELAALTVEERRDYDALLSENDHDLYGWFTWASPAPLRWQSLLARIRAFHRLD
ncbi:MAG TPA: succinate dehydrogenase assembly factor 2 [Paracoccaceae bacterium]|nr:succinate dehydrogenase assembly factor 2 [Paracoccaceae bacterium]